jgi:dTDP-4-dehydrorhamnose reductase
MTSKITKILILGATGMLGNTLYRYFRDQTSYKILGASRNSIVAQTMYQTDSAKLLSGIDVENIDALTQLLNKHRPDIVINCVGIIKQRDDADDPLAALPINALLPHRLGQLCGLLGARLIHISTDCVFSGKKGMYSEEDIPDAYDLYGRSKLLGEVSAPHAITIRTSLIGHELYSNKSLVNWFLSQTETVRGYRRAVFSGFPTVEIARIIDQYIIPNASLNGLTQISADPIDKYTLLNLIKEIYGKAIEIQPDDSIVIDRSLDSSRFRKLTGYQAPSWEEMISAMFDFD